MRGLAERSLALCAAFPADRVHGPPAPRRQPGERRGVDAQQRTLLVFPGWPGDAENSKARSIDCSGKGRLWPGHRPRLRSFPSDWSEDDVTTVLLKRHGAWGRAGRLFTKHVLRQPDVNIPGGLGPTLIPRPQRMYPARRSTRVGPAPSERTKPRSETLLSDLQALRESGPVPMSTPLAGPCPAWSPIGQLRLTA